MRVAQASIHKCTQATRTSAAYRLERRRRVARNLADPMARVRVTQKSANAAPAARYPTADCVRLLSIATRARTPSVTII